MLAHPPGGLDEPQVRASGEGVPRVEPGKGYRGLARLAVCAGGVAREADPGNRRVHRVELTGVGLALFDRLRDAAREHDERLRSGLDEGDVARVAAALERMRRNVRGT